MELSWISLPATISSENEDHQLEACNQWIVSQGLPAGELMYELVHPETKDAIAILDLVWNDGLQPGLSQPIALLLHESQTVEEAANQAGYRYFTTIQDFKDYVFREVLSRSQDITC